MNDDNKMKPGADEATNEPAAEAAAHSESDAKAADAAPAANDTEAAVTEPEADPRDTEIAGLKDKLLRAMAEAENVRRRTAREKEDAHKFAIANFAKDLAEIADNLRRALDSVPQEAAGDDVVKTLVEGVQMTEAALIGVFERHGIRRIDPAGQKFDPNLHEAMTEIEDPSAPAGTVVQVFQTGYVLNDRLLRPARVVVSRGGAKTESSQVDTTA